jgi:hypothetical protein
MRRDTPSRSASARCVMSRSQRAVRSSSGVMALSRSPRCPQCTFRRGYPPHGAVLPALFAAQFQPCDSVSCLKRVHCGLAPLSSTSRCTVLMIRFA